MPANACDERNRRLDRLYLVLDAFYVICATVSFLNLVFLSTVLCCITNSPLKEEHHMVIDLNDFNKEN